MTIKQIAMHMGTTERQIIDMYLTDEIKIMRTKHIKSCTTEGDEKLIPCPNCEKLVFQQLLKYDRLCPDCANLLFKALWVGTKEWEEGDKNGIPHKITYANMAMYTTEVCMDDIRESNSKKQERRKVRCKKDPAFKMRLTLARRLSETLTASGVYKTKTTMELCGCDRDYLKEHLEAKFYDRKDGTRMTFENHGKHGWHIDHIRPCASFDLTDPEQQKQCFHYTNLQPLWAEDNLRKSDKWSGE